MNQDKSSNKNRRDNSPATGGGADSGRSMLPAAVTILGLCLIGAASWYFTRPPVVPGDPPGGAVVNPDTAAGEPVSRELAEQLITKANRAHGLLEDETADAGRNPDGEPFEGYIESIKLYEQLRDDLQSLAPNATMPTRNLAIARSLQLLYGIPDEDRTPADYERAVKAVGDFKTQLPNSAVPHLMLAAIREKGLDFDAAIDASLADLREARRLEPDSIAAHFAFVQAAELAAGDEQVDRERAESFDQLYRLAPNNIELLKSYPAFLARQKNPALKDVLKQSRDLLTVAGRMHAIKTAQPKGTNKVVEYLDQALAAMDAGDWRKTLQSTMIMGNSLNGLAIQLADLKLLRPYFLEYIDFKFSESFLARIEDRKTQSESSQQPGELFSDRSSISIPVAFQSMAVVDFDHDVDADVVGISEGQVSVVAQQEDKSWKVSLTHDLEGEFDGVLVADLDRDNLPDEAWREAMKAIAGDANRSKFLDEDYADPDVVVFGKSGFKVLINDGDHLTQVEQNEDIAAIRNVSAAVLVDLEADSDLDLVLATDDGLRLLLNIGRSMFVDFSDASVLPTAETRINSLRIVDWDRDADIDIVAGLSDQPGVGILENLLHGRFRWRKLAGGFADLDSSRTLDLAEVDGNVSWDLIAAGKDGIQVCLTNTGQSSVDSKSVTATDRKVSRLLTADLDNDAFVDLVGWQDDRLHLLGQRATVDGGVDFQSATAEIKADAPIVSCAAADVELDGDLDLLVSTESGTTLYLNQSKQNGWINLLPVGIDENKGRVNHNGIGSLVELKSGDRYQAQVVNSPRVHFGLGSAAKADVLRIVWTNGMPQNIIDPAARLVIRETMFAKGSCPFIYVWNGQQFEFFSDCLWGAPIGLQLAERFVAPTRPWEYLKIPGELMAADGDFYRLQLTEELWEAAYFDQVELIAVDHPADVDVFTNEKVGPTSIAEHKIFAVAEPRTPIAATDKQGRDVLDLIATQDGRHMQGFEKTLRKGLAPQHYLQLDPGDLQDAQQITLFLTGWIRPSDSSLNVHFSQHQSLEGPRPPEVFVPDSDGKWQRVVSPMGFPGGKTKTMAVDLSKAFLTDDYRLRIQTSNEIYWDHVFFAVDEAQHAMKTFAMPVDSADVHYRGFSRNYFKDSQSPEWFDYQQVSTTPRWPPMTGRFTRYGDVTGLLNAADDRMVVIGAGDEITVSFRVPKEEVPAGWKRDFILHSVGYDKDADLNTLTGQSSEPLPFLQMRNYPMFEADDQFPATPEHQEYLRQFQTRRQSWNRFWKDVAGHDPAERGSVD